MWLPSGDHTAYLLSFELKVKSIEVRPHDLETYDELARNHDDDPDD